MIGQVGRLQAGHENYVHFSKTIDTPLDFQALSLYLLLFYCNISLLWSVPNRITEGSVMPRLSLSVGIVIPIME